MQLRIDDIYQRLRPILGQQVEELYTAYMLTTDRDRKARLEKMLHFLYAKHVDRAFTQDEILLEPPPQDIADGDFPIGEVLYTGKKLYPFALREKELTSHVGIAGMTGSGKTTCAFWILGNLLKRGIPFMVLDWKRTYRALLRGKHGKPVRIFTVGKDVTPFSLNPLIPPPGTSPRIWLKMITEVIGDAYFVGEGVLYLLNKAIDAAYSKLGVYAGTQERYPTLRDVKDWLDEHKPRSMREQQWIASALRTIWSLCFGETGKLFNAPQQAPIEQLLEQNVVFEMESLNERDKTFVVGAMLLWIHYYRLGQPDRERLKHVIVLEESHHILRKSNQSKESIMDVVFREERELGGAFIWIDQQPSGISRTALANTGTFIGMSSQSRADIMTAASTLLLDKDEARYLPQLKVGQAIVRSRYHRPFLVQIPPLAMDRSAISDAELREAQGGTDSGYSATEQPPLEWNGSDQAVPLSEGIPRNTLSLLLDIVQHPFSGVGSRYKRLGVSVRNGTKLKDDLVSRKLLAGVEVTEPSGMRLGLVVTPQGKEAMEREGHEVDYHLTPRLFEHEYWKSRIGCRLKKLGWEVRYEVPVPGDGFVDLVATKGSETAAWEVELGEDALRNIEKCVAAGYKRVVSVVVHDGEPMERVKRDVALRSPATHVIIDVKSAVQVLGELPVPSLLR